MSIFSILKKKNKDKSKKKNKGQKKGHHESSKTPGGMTSQSGVEKGNFFPKKSLPFEKKGISEWRSSDNVDWFCSIGFSEVSQKFANFLENGEELLNMDISMDIREELGEMSEERKDEFFVYYTHLKKTFGEESQPGDLFTQNFHTVFQKFKFLNGMKKYSIEEMEEHCAILSDKKKILKYLLTAKDTDVDIKIVINEAQFQYKNPNLLKKQEYQPQDVVVDFPRQFGDFNSSVFVGPYLLQWTNTELLIPLYGVGEPLDIILNSDPIVVDIRLSDKTKYQDELAALIEEYNSKYAYDDSVSKKNHNCQGFLGNLLKQFNTNLDGNPSATKSNGALKLFLERLPIRNEPIDEKRAKKGEVDLCGKISYTPTDEFTKLCNVNGFKKMKKIPKSSNLTLLFESHEDIDHLLFHTYRKNPLYYPPDHKLLKAIDRAYWLRFLYDTKGDKKKYQPLGKTKNKRCPTFGFKPELIGGCRYLHPRDIPPK